MVGYNYDNSSVENCYNTGSVTATGNDAFVCGVVGLNIGTVRYCYYDKSVCGEIGAVAIADDNTDNVKGLSTAEMTGTSAIGTADNQMNFSDTSVWLVRAADEFYSYYPHLKGFDLDKDGNQLSAGDIRKTDWPARLLKDGVREISDYDELKEFASAVNGGETDACAVLVSDIDASASAETNDWTPIGNDFNNYTGTFDGDGHKIIGLTINDLSFDCAGLFGFVGAGGVVQNVGLEGGSITGDRYVGGVAGYNSGTVTNCYNTGGVTAPGSNARVGGVVGYNYGTVTNCYNTGNVSGGYYVGGVVGFNYSSTISNCYNTGSVTATADYAYVGGVAGYNFEGTITNCYNTGGFTSQGNYARVGGVVGNNTGTVTNCYNTGDTTVNGTNRSYTYGGGVVGRNIGTVRYCYYDKSVCGEIGAVNGADDNTNNVTGRTTAQMTGESALENMAFSYGSGEESPWLTKADGYDEASGKYYWFYPHLKGFNFNDDLTQMTGDEIEAADWPAKVEITVGLSDGNSCTYDGEKHGVYVTVGDSSAPEGATVKYSQYNYSAEDNKWEWDEISDSPTDPGNYRMTARDGDKVIETKYFTILEQATDYTVSYYKKTGEDWFTDSVDPVNAGDYKAVVTFTAEGHTPIEKVFNIAPKPVAVTACGPDGPTKAYNGQEQVHTDSVIWIYDREETGLDDSKLRYTGNTTVKGTDAGRHSVDLSAEYCFCDDRNYDVTFTAEGDFDFDISKSVLTVTADNQETDYGEDLAGLTYKIEPRFGSYYNTDELGITLSTDADKNKAGTYDITVTVPDNPNYLITTQKGTYTVRQIDPVATVTAEDIDYGQTAVVTFTVPADAKGKVTFTLDEAESGVTKDIENGQAVCEFENLTIGSHKVECVYTGDSNYESGDAAIANFEVKSIDCALTINYVYADGTEAAESYVDEIAIFTQYSVTSPEITGYTPDKATVEGTMESLDGVTETVTYTPIEYTATFVDENGETVEAITFTVETESITEPDVPEKTNYTGEWEEYTLGANDITIKPVYTLAGETLVNTDSESEITTDYKESKRFVFEPEFVPEGATAHVFYNGEDRGEGTSIEVKEPTDDYTVECKVLDENGNEIASSGEIKVKVKNSFFDRLKWFFNNFWANILKTFIDAIIKAC